MKTTKPDLLELQEMYLDLNHARQPRKDRVLKAIEKLKNRIPEHLAQRVEDYHSKGRVAVVPLVHGSCGGCFLTLPGGVVNSLAAQDGLYICENCGCFVYPQKQQESSPAEVAFNI